MPSRAKILGGLVLLGAGAVAGLPRARDYMRNSHHLWQMERVLAKLRHAPRTFCVSQQARVGLLMGGEGRCDFFAGQLRTYCGSPDAILAHYRDATIPNPLTGRPEGLRVLFPGEDPIRDGLVPPELCRLSAWGIPAGRACPPSYIVYVCISAPANADPRCR